MSNTFGTLFRITSFGESHGEGIGVVIDGCPAGLALDLAFIQSELDRRKPGQSRITTQRKENDDFQLLSGHFEGRTTGTPLAFWVPNTNARSRDYNHIAKIFRPSHADYTYQAKYGLRDYRGGGRSSARETIARVIGGAVAKLFLKERCGTVVNAWVESIHQLRLSEWPETFELKTEYQQAVRCPDAGMAERMYHLIDSIRKEGNSVGGVVACQARSVPVGLGEPIYDKLEARLASAMLSINATKGFEIGSGFGGTQLKGSEHNDLFYSEGDRIRTRTNRSGGVQGGISNGEDVWFRVAFKPTATIMQDQQTVDEEGKEAIAEGKGRHDPCVVPRAVPIVESMCALVLADFVLLQQSRGGGGKYEGRRTNDEGRMTKDE
jgi:chorismate synthase